MNGWAIIKKTAADQRIPNAAGATCRVARLLNNQGTKPDKLGSFVALLFHHSTFRGFKDLCQSVASWRLGGVALKPVRVVRVFRGSPPGGVAVRKSLK
jgi:hypothetical protein